MIDLVSSNEENKKSDVFKKPRKDDIQDQDIVSAISYDQNAAFARYA